MKYILNDIIVTLNFLGVTMDLWIHRRPSGFFLEMHVEAFRGNMP